MFTIKGRKYNDEYEGLILLCVKYGKFGHYKEECHDKTIFKYKGDNNESRKGCVYKGE